MDAAFLDHFGPGYQMLLRTTLESRFGGTQPQDEAVLLESGYTGPAYGNTRVLLSTRTRHCVPCTVSGTACYSEPQR